MRGATDGSPSWWKDRRLLFEFSLTLYLHVGFCFPLRQSDGEEGNWRAQSRVCAPSNHVLAPYHIIISCFAFLVFFFCDGEVVGLLFFLLSFQLALLLSSVFFSWSIFYLSFNVWYLFLNNLSFLIHLLLISDFENDQADNEWDYLYKITLFSLNSTFQERILFYHSFLYVSLFKNLICIFCCEIHCFVAF